MGDNYDLEGRAQLRCHCDLAASHDFDFSAQREIATCPAPTSNLSADAQAMFVATTQARMVDSLHIWTI